MYIFHDSIIVLYNVVRHSNKNMFDSYNRYSLLAVEKLLLGIAIKKQQEYSNIKSFLMFYNEIFDNKN